MWIIQICHDIQGVLLKNMQLKYRRIIHKKNVALFFRTWRVFENNFKIWLLESFRSLENFKFVYFQLTSFRLCQVNEPISFDAIWLQVYFWFYNYTINSLVDVVNVARFHESFPQDFWALSTSLAVEWLYKQFFEVICVCKNGVFSYIWILSWRMRIFFSIFL